MPTRQFATATKQIFIPSKVAIFYRIGQIKLQFMDAKLYNKVHFMSSIKNRSFNKKSLKANILCYSYSCFEKKTVISQVTFFIIYSSMPTCTYKMQAKLHGSEKIHACDYFILNKWMKFCFSHKKFFNKALI